MNIAALLRGVIRQQPPQLRLPQLRLNAERGLPTSAQGSTTLQISAAARNMATKAVDSKPSTTEAVELRDFLSQFDFSSITPRQMAQVGGRLFEQREISESAASAFVGVETNLVQEMDPDKPIDMRQHFQHMLDAATGGDVTVPGELDFAIQFRQKASAALDDVISFVGDDRSHVSS